MTSPLTKRLTQAEADREVWEFLDRVSRVANNDRYVYEVEFAFIGGAYLLRGGSYEDLEIAVLLRRKPRGAPGASPLREKFRQRRVKRVLQGGRPRLRLVTPRELGSYEILYQAPDANPPEGLRVEDRPLPDSVA